MTTTEEKEEAMMRLVIEEIDEARDTYELVKQLAPALPLKSVKDVRKIAGPKGTLSFRGQHYDITPFEALLPETAFPIDDVASLVARAAQFVRLVPAGVGIDMNDPKVAARYSRRAFSSGQAPTGLPRGQAAFKSGIPAPSHKQPRRDE